MIAWPIVQKPDSLLRFTLSRMARYAFPASATRRSVVSDSVQRFGDLMSRAGLPIWPQ